MEKVISRDGTTIAFDRLGNGPPIILVDGAFCSRKFGPVPKLAPILAQQFTVIAYDRRGRGDSGDTAPYSVEREIEDLEALIDAAGGSAYVWAMSSGAALAIRASASGLNIKKMALYEPPFMVGKTGHRPPVDHEAQLNRFISLGQRGDAAKFALRKIMGAPSIIVTIMQLTPVWSKLKALANTLPYDAAIMEDYSLPTNLLASVAVPTLVNGGEKSPDFLRNAVRAVADTIPNARHSLLKGQNHNVSMKVLAPELLEYFKTL
jgi:pimeloyl-ACP methyl ester carboxylesterase